MFVCLLVVVVVFFVFLDSVPDTIPAQVHTTQQLLVCLVGKVFLLLLLTLKILTPHVSFLLL